MDRPTYTTPPSVAWLLVNAVTCDECSAIVVNMAEHDRFHERIEADHRLLHPHSG